MVLGSGIQDPGSGKNLFRIRDPGSRGQKGTGYRIPDPDPQHRRQVKVLIKYLAIFFLSPSKYFLPISLKIQLLLQYLNHEY